MADLLRGAHPESEDCNLFKWMIFHDLKLWAKYLSVAPSVYFIYIEWMGKYYFFNGILRHF